MLLLKADLTSVDKGAVEMASATDTGHQGCSAMSQLPTALPTTTPQFSTALYTTIPQQTTALSITPQQTTALSITTTQQTTAMSSQVSASAVDHELVPIFSGQCKCPCYHLLVDGTSNCKRPHNNSAGLSCHCYTVMVLSDCHGTVRCRVTNFCLL